MIWEEDLPWDVLPDAFSISSEACGCPPKVKDSTEVSCSSRKEHLYWEVKI
jgi:hypothetical protein